MVASGMLVSLDLEGKAYGVIATVTKTTFDVFHGVRGRSTFNLTSHEHTEFTSQNGELRGSLVSPQSTFVANYVYKTALQRGHWWNERVNKSIQSQYIIYG